MTQQQTIVKGDTLQKISSVGFIIGAILLVNGSLLLPQAAVPNSNWQEMQKELGDQAVRFQASALLMTFGYWAVMIGTAGVYRSITMGGAAWARMGFYLLLMGTAVVTVGMSLDVSYPAAIVNWLAAPAAAKETAYSVVAAIPGIGRGTFPMIEIVIWLAFALLGIGMVQSAVYPRWLGLVGLILGISGVLLGIMQTFTGRESSFILYLVLVFLTVLWWLVIGIWVARKAW